MVRMIYRAMHLNGPEAVKEDIPMMQQMVEKMRKVKIYESFVAARLAVSISACVARTAAGSFQATSTSAWDFD